MSNLGPCASCNGTGRRWGEDCDDCGGDGMAVSSEYSMHGNLPTKSDFGQCPSCNGTGRSWGDDCDDCGGTGKAR